MNREISSEVIEGNLVKLVDVMLTRTIHAAQGYATLLW